MFDVVQKTLASAVAADATFTVGYPAGRDASSYSAGGDHIIAANGYPRLKSRNGDFTVAFTSTVTVTNKTGGALPAGLAVFAQLDRIAGETDVPFALPAVMSDARLTVIDLGAPDVADPNGVCASQAITAAGTGALAGALASGGVATFDVPRNVVAAWTGTAVLTVTGTDVYGSTVVESSASGTSLAGKKAFKTITAVDVSANVTGATVGTGDVIGLPVRLPSLGYVLKELQDGAAATAGTLVAGVTTAATATTGDVRGTYDPNAAADGAKAFLLFAALPDPGDKGVSQFAG